MSFEQTVLATYIMIALYAVMLLIRRGQVRRLTERTEAKHEKQARYWFTWLEYMRFVKQQERNDVEARETQNA